MYYLWYFFLSLFLVIILDNMISLFPYLNFFLNVCMIGPEGSRSYFESLLPKIHNLLRIQKEEEPARKTTPRIERRRFSVSLSTITGRLINARRQLLEFLRSLLSYLFFLLVLHWIVPAGNFCFAFLASWLFSTHFPPSVIYLIHSNEKSIDPFRDLIFSVITPTNGIYSTIFFF